MPALTNNRMVKYTRTWSRRSPDTAAFSSSAVRAGLTLSL
jgi:hypothetical protein